MSEPGYPWSRGNTLYADKLNEAFINKIERAGDTMTGPLRLSGDPTASNMAATKNYVDQQIAANMGGGGGGVGASITVSDTQPATPAQNSLWFDSVGCQLYLWYNDGTSTQWVNTTNAGIGPSIVASDTAPTSPASNMLWWDSVGLQLYVWYYDGNSSQWVPANNQNATIGEAATDGILYGRRNASWNVLEVQPELNKASGRNFIQNPGFRINQRSFSFTGASGYMFDRWVAGIQTDTSTISSQSATDTMRGQVGNEDVINVLSCTTAALGAAASYTEVYHRILNVKRLSNKTVTVSFYANASVNTAKLGVSLDQIFGTGGSPSASVFGNGNAITISGGTTWARYSTTFTIPSVAGKVFGTNTDDCTQLNFWYSSGSNNAARAGSIGVQNGITINIWGVQLEISDRASPFDQPEFWRDVADCCVYFNGGQIAGVGNGPAGARICLYASFPVAMRAIPTFNITGTAYNNCSNAVVYLVNQRFVSITANVTALGDAGLTLSYTASADL